MNPLIQYSKDNLSDKVKGNKRFYARFSQSESVPAPIAGGIERILMFEAFDSQWFDNNPLPKESVAFGDYYDKASLFLLWARVYPRHTSSFPVLEQVVKAAGEDEEPDQWYVFETDPSGGRRLGENDLEVTIFANLYQAGVQAVAKDFQVADKDIATRLRASVSTSHIKDATEREIDDALKPVSVAAQCYRDKLELSNPAKETWWINGNPRTWFVQAAQLPTVPEDKNYPKVVVLLFPSGYRKNFVSI